MAKNKPAPETEVERDPDLPPETEGEPVTEDAKKKGGKSAFDVEKGKTYKFPPEEIVIIGLDTAHAPGSHPLFPPSEQGRLEAFDEIDEDMVATIRQHGVIMAPTCVKIPIRLKGEGTEGLAPARPVVVAGRRRILHARELNKRLRAANLPEIQVAVTLRQGNLDDQREVAVIENEQRKGTPVLAKAMTALEFISRGATEERVCTIFGWSKRSLEQHLTLAGLHPKVRDLYKEGNLTLAAAEDIAKYPHDEQEAYVAKLLKAGGGRANRQAVQTNNGQKPTPNNRAGMTTATLQKIYAELPASPGSQENGGTGESEEEIQVSAEDLRLVKAVIRWTLSKEVEDPRLEAILKARVVPAKAVTPAPVDPVKEGKTVGAAPEKAKALKAKGASSPPVTPPSTASVGAVEGVVAPVSPEVIDVQGEPAEQPTDGGMAALLAAISSNLEKME